MIHWIWVLFAAWAGAVVAIIGMTIVIHTIQTTFEKQMLNLQAEYIARERKTDKEWRTLTNDDQ